MPNFLKPQSPLKAPNGDYFYPMTTSDQIIMNDGTRLNGQGLVAQTDLSPITADITKLNGIVSNYNFLDNPFFTINQRGVTTWSDGVYGVDRWKNQARSTCSISNGVITCTTTQSGAWAICQRHLNSEKSFIGRTVTISAKLGDDSIVSYTTFLNSSATETLNYYSEAFGNLKFLIQVTHQDDGDYVLTFGLVHVLSGIVSTVKAMKLEFGTASTLANDAPPNYATTLLKCKRYYQSFGTTFVSGHMTTATTAKLTLPLMVEMRTSPAWVGGTTLLIVGAGKTETRSVTPTEVSGAKRLDFNITTSVSFGSNNTIEVQFNKIELSADL